MVSKKKIVLFLVEGINDKTALGVALIKLISTRTVRFEITYGDITSDIETSTSNILRKLGDIVNRFRGKIYKKSDFLEIVHLIDLDGTFVPKKAIVYLDCDNPIYENETIKCKNVDYINARNIRKQGLINKLVATSKICDIPYSLYFFSSNLDHVLFNEPNLSKKEKAAKADEIERKFNENPTALLLILNHVEICLCNNYQQSWQDIAQGTESLHRHSNFNVFFGSYPKNPSVLYND